MQFQESIQQKCNLFANIRQLKPILCHFFFVHPVRAMFCSLLSFIFAHSLRDAIMKYIVRMVLYYVLKSFSFAINTEDKNKHILLEWCSLKLEVEWGRGIVNDTQFTGVSFSVSFRAYVFLLCDFHIHQLKLAISFVLRDGAKQTAKDILMKFAIFSIRNRRFPIRSRWCGVFDVKIWCAKKICATMRISVGI